jgi:hypothetical protein
MAEGVLSSIDETEIISALELSYEIGLAVTRISLGGGVDKIDLEESDIEQAVNALEEFLDNRIYRPTNAYEELLVEKLELQDCVWPGFVKRLNEYIEHYGDSEAKLHIDHLYEVKEKMKNIFCLASAFGLPRHDISDGDGEFCISLPYDDSEKLTFINSELKVVLNGLKHLSEIGSGKTDDPKVSVIEKGSLTAIFTVAAGTAATAYLVIKSITDLIEKYFDIRIKAIQLKELKERQEKEQSGDMRLQERVFELEKIIDELTSRLEIHLPDNEDYLVGEEFKQAYLQEISSKEITSITNELMLNKPGDIPEERAREVAIGVRRFSEWMSKRLADGSRITSVSYIADEFMISEKDPLDEITHSERKKLEKALRLLEQQEKGANN